MVKIKRLKTTGNKRVLLNILSLNARSDINKIDKLVLVIHNHNSDVVAVSETWLSDNVSDEALHFPSIPDFSVIRNDKNNRVGGGVAFFIREQLPCKVRVYGL